MRVYGGCRAVRIGVAAIGSKHYLRQAVAEIITVNVELMNNSSIGTTLLDDLSGRTTPYPLCHSNAHVPLFDHYVTFTCTSFSCFYFPSVPYNSYY